MMMSVYSKVVISWKSLVGPYQAIQDDRDRWRAILLANVSIVALVFISPLFLIEAFVFNRYESGNLLTYVVSASTHLIVYFLARHGRYLIGAVIDVILGSGFIFLWALYLRNEPSYIPFFYLSTTILFSGIFLPLSMVVLLGLLNLGSLLLVGILVPELPLDQIINRPLTFNLVLIIIALFLGFYFRQSYRSQQQKIIDSEERYRNISELISDYAYSHKVGEQGQLELDWITDSFYKITGYTREEVTQFHRSSGLYHPEDRARVDADMKRLMAGETVDEEYRILHKDSSVIWVRVFRRPIFDEHTGKLTRMYGVAKNITWRKDAEFALKTSEERYRIISEMISDYAFTVAIDEAGYEDLNWVTEPFARITGYSYQEAMDSIKNLVLFHPDDHERVRNDLKIVISGKPVTAEYRMITKSGDMRWVRIYRRPIWDEKAGRVTRFYGVTQDITEQKQMTDALQISEQRYRLISELVLGYAFSVRVEDDGSLTSEWRTEDLYERTTGYKADEMITHYESAKYPLYHPDDWPTVESAIKRTLAGENTVYEHRIITKSGETRWLQVFRRPVWDEQKQCFARFYGAALDITELKRSEEQKLKLVVEQERMKLMSQFVLAISHEFRTTISNIETSRYLIERRLAEEARAVVQTKLDMIHDSVVRLREQLDNLGTITTLSEEGRTHVDFTELVRVVLYEQNHRVEENQIQIDFDHPPLPIPVHVDRTRLAAAIRQLILNAINHTPHDGMIHISLYTEDHMAVLCVIDHGEGIASDDLPYIFDYFYRDDPARPISDGGIGLGLSIVKMVVEAHGGYVAVESQPGKGSTFKLLIPMAEQNTT